MSEVARVHLWVSGRVQGVFYRAECREAAQGLGLAGWVRNLDDGRVEALAEGPKEKIDEFLAWCHRGPRLAQVTGVEVRWEEPRGDATGFRVTH